MLLLQNTKVYAIITKYQDPYYCYQIPGFTHLLSCLGAFAGFALLLKFSAAINSILSDSSWGSADA
jgi:hypothetical protein